MTYLASLGRGHGGHGGHGGGGHWHGGGGWGGWGGGWGPGGLIDYDSAIDYPTPCYDIRGNIVPCPVLVSGKPVNGLASLLGLGDITVPVLGKIGLPALLVAVGVAAYAIHKKHQ